MSLQIMKLNVFYMNIYYKEHNNIKKVKSLFLKIHWAFLHVYKDLG